MNLRLEAIYKHFSLKYSISCHTSVNVAGALCILSKLYHHCHANDTCVVHPKQSEDDALPNSVFRESRLSKRPCLSQTVAVNVEVADTMM